MAVLMDDCLHYGRSAQMHLGKAPACGYRLQSGCRHFTGAGEERLQGTGKGETSSFSRNYTKRQLLDFPLKCRERQPSGQQLSLDK